MGEVGLTLIERLSPCLKLDRLSSSCKSKLGSASTEGGATSTTIKTVQTWAPGTVFTVSEMVSLLVMRPSTNTEEF